MRPGIRCVSTLTLLTLFSGGYIWADTLLYVTHPSTNSLSIIDRNLKTVKSTVPCNAAPSGMAMTPDGRKAYISQGNTIAVLPHGRNSLSHTISLPAGANPKEVAVSSDGERAYVADAGRHVVLVINTSNDTVTSSIPVDSGPAALALHPVLSHLYVVHPAINRISTVNLTTATVTGSLLGSNQPQSMAVSPDGSKAYVTNFGANTVSVFLLSTSALISTIHVGMGPKGIALTRDGRYAYVANSGSNNLSVIDLVTNTVTSTVAVGTSPSAVALPRGGAWAYVSNSGAGTVSVLSTQNSASPVVTSTIAVGGNPQILGATPFDWHTYGNHIGRINYNGLESTITPTNAPNLVLQYFHTLTGEIVGSPIIAEGIVTTGCAAGCDVMFIADNSSKLLAINADTGALLWQTAIGSTKQSSINGLAIQGSSATAFYDRSRNYVYAVSGNGKLYALNAANGSIIAGWPVQVIDTKRERCYKPKVGGLFPDEYVWGGINSDGTWVYVGIATGGGYFAQGKVVAVKIAHGTTPPCCYEDSPNPPGGCPAITGCPTVDTTNCKVQKMWNNDQLAHQGSGVHSYGAVSVSSVFTPADNQNYLFVGTGNHGTHYLDPNSDPPRNTDECEGYMRTPILQNELFNNGDHIITLRGTEFVPGGMGIRQTKPGQLLFPGECRWENLDMSSPTLFQPVNPPANWPCNTAIAAAVQKQGWLNIFFQTDLTINLQNPIMLPATENSSYTIGNVAYHPDSFSLFVRYFYEHDASPANSYRHCVARINYLPNPPGPCQYNDQIQRICLASTSVPADCNLNPPGPNCRNCQNNNKCDDHEVSSPALTSNLLFFVASQGPTLTRKLHIYDISSGGMVDKTPTTADNNLEGNLGAAPIVYKGTVLITTRARDPDPNNPNPNPGCPNGGCKIYAFGPP